MATEGGEEEARMTCVQRISDGVIFEVDERVSFVDPQSGIYTDGIVVAIHGPNEIEVGYWRSSWSDPKYNRIVSIDNLLRIGKLPKNAQRRHGGNKRATPTPPVLESQSYADSGVTAKRSPRGGTPKPGHEKGGSSGVGTAAKSSDTKSSAKGHGNDIPRKTAVRAASSSSPQVPTSSPPQQNQLDASTIARGGDSSSSSSSSAAPGRSGDRDRGRPPTVSSSSSSSSSPRPVSGTSKDPATTARTATRSFTCPTCEVCGKRGPTSHITFAGSKEWICEKCQARGLRPGERATSTAQNGVGKNASSGKETVGESRKKEASGTGGSMNPQETFSSGQGRSTPVAHKPSLVKNEDGSATKQHKKRGRPRNSKAQFSESPLGQSPPQPSPRNRESSEPSNLLHKPNGSSTTNSSSGIIGGKKDEEEGGGGESVDRVRSGRDFAGLRAYSPLQANDSDKKHNATARGPSASREEQGQQHPSGGGVSAAAAATGEEEAGGPLAALQQRKRQRLKNLTGSVSPSHPQRSASPGSGTLPEPLNDAKQRVPSPILSYGREAAGNPPPAPAGPLSSSSWSSASPPVSPRRPRAGSLSTSSSSSAACASAPPFSASMRNPPALHHSAPYDSREEGNQNNNIINNHLSQSQPQTSAAINFLNRPLPGGDSHSLHLVLPQDVNREERERRLREAKEDMWTAVSALVAIREDVELRLRKLQQEEQQLQQPVLSPQRPQHQQQQQQQQEEPLPAPPLPSLGPSPLPHQHPYQPKQQQPQHLSPHLPPSHYGGPGVGQQQQEQQQQPHRASLPGPGPGPSLSGFTGGGGGGGMMMGLGGGGGTAGGYPPPPGGLAGPPPPPPPTGGYLGYPPPFLQQQQHHHQQQQHHPMHRGNVFR